MITKDSVLKRDLFFIFCSFLLTGCFVFLFAVTNSHARNVNFSWISNDDDPPADGYKLYYKTGNPGSSLNDYDGTDAGGNNPSPVVIAGQNSSSYTLSNLLDSEKYSFVLTAYRGSDESPPTDPETVDAIFTNGPPVASNSSFSTAENTSYTGQLVAEDPDGDSLNYSIVSNGSRGSATITNASTGAFTYTPGNNQVGSDSFTFKVNDGTVNSNTATVSVTITNVNDPPTATSSSFSITKNTTYTGQLQAEDPDGDALTYNITNNGNKGSAVITNQNTGAFTYTPDHNATGTDSFKFRVNDGTVNSTKATVTVTILQQNSPPVAYASNVSVAEDNSHSGQLNASDPDDDSLIYSIVSNGSKGTAVINNSSTGAFTYTPAQNQNGSDSFTFRVNDGVVNSATATVTVNISAVNDRPIVGNLSINVAQNFDYTGQLSGSDVDGDDLTFVLVSNGLKGDADIDNPANGSFTYTPFENETGADSFTFKVNDGTIDSILGVVTVNISAEEEYTVSFGDFTGADYPGTISDTFVNIDSTVNALSETINTYSWSNPTPHKVANSIIIKADLSSIPTNATITGAELQLYLVGYNGASQYSQSVHKISGRNPAIDQANGFNASNGTPWSEVPAGTTYDDIPLGLADTEAEEDTIVVGSEDGYKVWRIPAMVQGWVNQPASNYGLLIRGVTTSVETGRYYAASENQNGSIRPKLIIRYTTAPPVLEAPELILIEEVK